MNWLPRPLRERWRAWWHARHRPTERWTLTQRNVYILPTKAGMAFVVTLFLLLLASINYQLNLGYALTFLLAGSALASMHMTHGTLRGLTLHLRPVQPAFAGGTAHIEIVASNPGRQRPAVAFAVVAGDQPPHWSWCAIAAASQDTVHLGYAATVRGLHELPMIAVETRFPFGLFRAWTLWRPAGQLCVYPKPESPAASMPDAQSTSDRPGTRRVSHGGEFDGLRPWRRGDGLRQVVWKKVARTGELVSREQSAAPEHELWLEWSTTRLREPEARLSRLAAWVLEADRRQLRYGLKLPGVTLDASQGDEQCRRALQALATWD